MCFLRLYDSNLEKLILGYPVPVCTDPVPFGANADRCRWCRPNSMRYRKKLNLYEIKTIDLIKNIINIRVWSS